MHVFVVDDRIDTRESLAAYLRLAGCAVDTAASGGDALARMDAGPPPDAVITDHLMPGMTGLELAEAMRRRPALAAVPVALLSGLPGAAPVTVADEVSWWPFHYFAKPASPAAVLDWLRQVIGEARP